MTLATANFYFVFYSVNYLQIRGTWIAIARSNGAVNTIGGEKWYLTLGEMSLGLLFLKYY